MNVDRGRDVDLTRRMLPEMHNGGSKPIPLPAWWKEIQEAAWLDYERLPMPSRKDERWRFTDLGKLAFTGYAAGAPVPESSRSELHAFFHRGEAPALLFANDTLLFSRSLSPEAKKKGVLLTPLLEAASGAADLLKSYLFRERVDLGAEKLEALHRACATAGALLYVPAGVELEQTVDLSFWLSEENAATFPHILVVLQENARARIHLRFGSTNPKGGFACSVQELFLGAGAQLEIFTARNWAEGTCSFDLASVRLDRDANATSFQLNQGGGYTRTESRSRLLGSGSRSVMLSATMARDRQEFDQRSFQEHSAPNTRSDLLYKSALYDSSRTIFAGMIDVDPGAQQTDAYQSNRNLLLSPDAEANALPGLEILANDVRCTHGATIGQVDPEELFYCLQRGIPLEAAQRLFVLGFLTDVIDRIPDADAKRTLAEEIDSSLSRPRHP